MTSIYEAYRRGERYRVQMGNVKEARRNRAFYAGRQWQSRCDGLPHPVFNLTRRVADYLVGHLLPEGLTVTFCDGALTDKKEEETKADALSVLSRHVTYFLRRDENTAVLTECVSDAVLTGNGAMLVTWDGDYADGSPYRGRVSLRRLNPEAVYFGDATEPDVEKQPFVLLVTRQPTEAVKNTALLEGFDEKTVALITPDGDGLDKERTGCDYTTVVYEYRKCAGDVTLTWATEKVTGASVSLGVSHYPIVWFGVTAQNASYLGVSPLTEIRDNQKIVNSAFALASKHMRDTAFSKVVYDKTRIPEWNNAPGEAIAVIGATAVNDAVTVLPVGQLQEGYLDLVSAVIEQTKAMTGAVDLSLGQGDAQNKGAILALQSAGERSLTMQKNTVRRALARLAERVGEWVLTAYPDDRQIPVGKGAFARAKISLLSPTLLDATISTKEFNYD